MAAENDMTRTISACSVEVSPSEVDAGADMTLKGKVSCSPAGDLRGKTLLIKDQDGAVAESVELTEFDGETNETSEFVVKAPVRPGAYTWLAVCLAHATAGMSHEETSAPFSGSPKVHVGHFASLTLGGGSSMLVSQSMITPMSADAEWRQSLRIRPPAFRLENHACAP